MDLQATLKALAPTVATALLGPMSGAAISGLCSILGVQNGTIETIQNAIANGQMTPEQVSKLKELELQYQNEEKERNFEYAELVFKDTADARAMATTTGAKTPAILTWIVVAAVFLLEGSMLFGVKPTGVDGVILGRILGTLDSALMLALSFWFGTSHGSQQKTEILAKTL